MYWYRLIARAAIPLISGILLITCLSACNSGGKETGALKYFDIKGYFKTDSIILTKKNRAVFKTVTHNGVTESKKVHITNWGQELGLFKESDINRPAWKDSYTVISNNDSLLFYKAKYADLRVREIIIKMDKKKVKWMLIFNKTPKNMLYQTIEKLTYFPDSLYIIRKEQTVRLMGINNYRIQGVISK